MPALRVPTAAMPSLRARIDAFLRSHNLLDGQTRFEIDFPGLALAEFLLAALHVALDEHPWLGRDGVILEPPYDDPPSAPIDLWTELDEDTLAVDTCLAALQKIVPFDIVDEPCGRRRPRPRPYRWMLADEPEAFRKGDVSLHESVFGVIAEEGWIHRASSRDEVFQEVLPPNESPISFVEIDAATATSLAQFLFAGPERPGARRAYRAQAEALVRLFGRATRCFAPKGLDIDDDEDPFARGAPWSRYDDAGNGSWGSTASVVVSDGERVAFVETIWDVSSE